MESLQTQLTAARHCWKQVKKGLVEEVVQWSWLTPAQSWLPGTVKQKQPLSFTRPFLHKGVSRAFLGRIQPSLVKLSEGVICCFWLDHWNAVLCCPSPSSRLPSCLEWAAARGAIGSLSQFRPGSRRLASALALPPCSPLLPREQGKTEGPCGLHKTRAVLQDSFFSRIITRCLIAIKQSVGMPGFQICFTYCHAETMRMSCKISLSS